MILASEAWELSTNLEHLSFISKGQRYIPLVAFIWNQKFGFIYFLSTKISTFIHLQSITDSKSWLSLRTFPSVPYEPPQTTALLSHYHHHHPHRSSSSYHTTSRHCHHTTRISIRPLVPRPLISGPLSLRLRRPSSLLSLLSLCRLSSLFNICRPSSLSLCRPSNLLAFGQPWSLLRLRRQSRTILEKSNIWHHIIKHVHFWNSAETGACLINFIISLVCVPWMTSRNLFQWRRVWRNRPSFVLIWVLERLMMREISLPLTLASRLLLITMLL